MATNFEDTLGAEIDNERSALVEPLVVQHEVLMENKRTTSDSHGPWIYVGDAVDVVVQVLANTGSPGTSGRVTISGSNALEKPAATETGGTLGSAFGLNAFQGLSLHASSATTGIPRWIKCRVTTAFSSSTSVDAVAKVTRYSTGRFQD